MIRLITRGDDMGSFRTANRAIHDAFQQGILRNASLMVPTPFFAEAAEICRGLPELCVGIHATLHCEWNEVRWGPVLGAARVPSLVMEDGTFFKDTVELWHRQPNYDEILAELSAQIHLAREAGVQVKYMDVHMCFDWYEGLLPLMKDMARREGLFLAAGEVVGKPESPFYALPAVEGTFADPVERLLTQLAQIDPAVVDKPYFMVTHPCYPDAEVAQVTCGDQRPGEMAADRDWDRRCYMDPRVIALCAERGIQFMRYSEMPVQG